MGWVGDETSDKVRFSEMTDGTTPLLVFWAEEHLKPFFVQCVEVVVIQIQKSDTTYMFTRYKDYLMTNTNHYDNNVLCHLYHQISLARKFRLMEVGGM